MGPMVRLRSTSRSRRSHTRCWCATCLTRCSPPSPAGEAPHRSCPAVFRARSIRKGSQRSRLQLARAADVLQSLSGDSATVVRLWESFVQNPNPGSRPPPTPPVTTTPVQPAQRLRVRDDGNVYAMLAEGGSLLCVRVGTSRELELTGVAVRFVQRMLAEREFVASDCLGWNDDGTAFAGTTSR